MPTVFVAADLHGSKTNYVVAIPESFTVAAFKRYAEMIFARGYEKERPAGVPQAPFSAHRIQFWDEIAGKWADITDDTLAKDWVQIYVFQKETAHHKEVQSKIPPPVPPPTIQSRDVSPASVPASPHLSPHRRAAGTPLSTAASSPRGPADPSEVQSERTTTPQPPLDLDAGASHAEKVRLLYSEMDHRRLRRVTRDEWMGCMQRWGVDLSESTLLDLFAKADTNRDGLVSPEEFDLWCSTYPRLAGSMYSKLRDMNEAMRRKCEIESARVAAEELQAAVTTARVAFEGAARNVDAQMLRVEEAACEVTETTSFEASVVASLEAIREKLENMRQRHRDSAHPAGQLAKEEAQLRDEHDMLRREADTIAQRLALQETVVARCEHRLAELERALVEQRSELQKQREAEERMRHELSIAQKRRTASATAVSEVEGAAELARQEQQAVERAVVEVEDEERSVVARLREAREATAISLSKQHEAERVLQQAKEEEARRRDALQSSKETAAYAVHQIAKLEDDLAEFDSHRAEVAAGEGALLLQEIRLREQRSTLEAREARHRTDHTSFVSHHRAAGTTPQPQPPPPPPPPPPAASQEYLRQAKSRTHTTPPPQPTWRRVASHPPSPDPNRPNVYSSVVP